MTAQPPAAPGPAAGQGAGGDEAGAPRSGLRNPERALRGLGAGTLVLEAVVLLLAIQPIRLLGGDLRAPAIATVLGLALAALVISGLFRHAWAWYAGGAFQVALLLAGLLHWSLAVLGAVFGAAWLYILHARRTLLRPTP